MSKRYESGTKNYVIRMALVHAIDDRESMIDGHTNRFYPEFEDNKYISPESEEYAKKCEAEVRDFKRMLETLQGK